MRPMRLHFQKGDFLAIAITVVLAAAVFVAFLPKQTEGTAVAEIYHRGELLQTVSLDEPQEFTLTYDYSNTVTVQDGKIAVTASDCPGADCVHSGWIGTSGRSLVCLPNALEIRVISQDSDVDFIVG